jgi:osmotically-inducible protein OsmY
MIIKKVVPDHAINQKVNHHLASRGMRPPCKVTALSSKGTVTLSGTIQYEHQRSLCVQAAGNVEGVRRVVDHLKVLVKAVQKAVAPPASIPHF